MTAGPPGPYWPYGLGVTTAPPGPVVAEGMAFGSAFGALFVSWPTAANGTTARSAPAKTNLRTLNIGTSPIPKGSPAVAAPLADARHLTPTFDVHGEYSRRG